MFNRLLLLTVLLSSTLLIGCQDQNIIRSDYTIRSGSSFGFCVGICYKELSLNEFQAVLRIDEDGRTNNSNARIQSKREVSNSEWSRVKNLVNEQAFKNLPDVIGCPDCADGGSEWIEIQSPDLSKRVVFEYGDPPSEIASLASILAQAREEMYVPVETASN